MNTAIYIAKLQSCVDRFNDELKKLRTGRAHPSMLDGIVIEAYGTQIPLNQAATITTPESQQIQISPFDIGNIGAIANAIRNNESLGLNPMDDGRVVRVAIPVLTEERRRDIAKQIGAKQEECMISLRSVRHEAVDEINKSKKDKEIGEDDAKRMLLLLEEEMGKARISAEASAKSKEKEIMTV